MPVHPDRRRDQPGQLRRAAVQHARRGGRHQLADLQPHRRLHGPVVRDPDRRRARRPEAAARQGPRRPRPHRRGDPGSDAGPRHLVRPRPAARRAGQLGGEGQPGGQGRASRRATSSSSSTASRSRLERPAAHRRLDAAGLASRRSKCWRKGQTRKLTITVGELQEDRVAARDTPARASRRPRRRPTASASWSASSRPSRRRSIEVSATAWWSPTCGPIPRPTCAGRRAAHAWCTRASTPSSSRSSSSTSCSPALDKNAVITLQVRRGESTAFVTISG